MRPAGGGDADNGEGGLLQDIKGGFVPGQTYRVSAWVKAEPGKTTPALIWLSDPDGGAGSLNTSSGTFMATENWQRVSVDFVATNGNPRTFLYRMTQSPSAGRIYWDDVTVGDPN